MGRWISFQDSFAFRCNQLQRLAKAGNQTDADTKNIQRTSWSKPGRRCDPPSAQENEADRHARDIKTVLQQLLNASPQGGWWTVRGILQEEIVTKDDLSPLWSTQQIFMTPIKSLMKNNLWKYLLVQKDSSYWQGGGSVKDWFNIPLIFYLASSPKCRV